MHNRDGSRSWPRRWYQFSIRSLLLLMLLTSMFMSWYATKMRRAIAQKKAVAAILAAGGTVAYDYQFDEDGQFIYRATGHGPQWLRWLLGPDYFDRVDNVYVNSKKGVEALAGLTNLKSLSICSFGPAKVAAIGPIEEDHWLTALPAIDGVETLTIERLAARAPLGQLAKLRHLRQLELDYTSGTGMPSDLEPPDLSGLRSLAELRRLTIHHLGTLTASSVDSINALGQLECLDVESDTAASFDVESIDNLRTLRDLALTGLFRDGLFLDGPAPDEQFELLPIGHPEQLRKFHRLEKLSVACTSFRSSDLRYLGELPVLRELNLTNCLNINDSAAVYLKQMKGLRRLNLEGTKITDAVAESIDEALPDCEVRY